MTCGHEWEKEEEEPGETVVRHTCGNVLGRSDGQGSQTERDFKMLKSRMKSKPIRLVDGDHDISRKIDGMVIGLKAQFVKKVQ